MSLLTHTERAQLRDKTEEFAGIHDLQIAGEDWSKKLLTASFAWTAEGAGGSNMDFEVEGNLEPLVDAPVSFAFGYGREDVSRYFRGRLQMPKEHDTLPQSSGIAFGPFRLLTDTYLRNTVTYQGKNLEYLMMDLSRRAEYPSGEFQILGGRKYNIPAGELFAMGTSLQEIANSVLERAKYVAFDAPGGRRIVMPKPVPGSNGSIKAVYQPGQYKTFTTEPSHEIAYHSVVVYRHDNSTWGGGAVYAERAVDAHVRFRPPKSRVFYVPDFPGTQSQAADEAMRLAKVLRDGEQQFSITMPFNRNITLYDGFRVTRIKNLGNGIQQREVYICTVDKEIAVTYAPGNVEMTMTGHCYEVKNERFEIDKRFEKRATSYGVVVPSDTHTAMLDTNLMPDTFELFD